MAAHQQRATRGLVVWGLTALLLGCTATKPASTPTPVTSSLTSAPTIAPIVPVAALPQCRASQVALDFRAGGFATQSVFGSIVIRDRSQDACRISGRIVVTALSRTGAPVGIAPLVWKAPVTSLSANAGRWPSHQVQPPTEHVLILAMMGREVDQPSGGRLPCEPQQPSAWRVAIDRVGTLETPNLDRDVVGEHGSAPSMFGCRGQIFAEGFVSGTG